jgi:hypothetical protein
MDRNRSIGVVSVEVPSYQMFDSLPVGVLRFCLPALSQRRTVPIVRRRAE